MYNWKVNTRECEQFTFNWSVFAEKENFPWDKREYIDNPRDFLWENEISDLYWK